MKTRWIPFQCCTSVYAAAENVWLIPTARMRRLSLVLTSSSTLSVYEFGICMEKLMQQPLIEFAKTIMYKKIMTQKRLCRRESSMTLEFIISITLELKGMTGYRLKSEWIYNLIEDRDHFLVHIPHEASLEITWTDGSVFQLWLCKPHLPSMKGSTANLRLDIQIQKECDRAKTLFQKTLLYIDANTRAPYWS